VAPAGGGSEPSARDYRDSHLDLGDDYDKTLAALPFDTWMTSQETQILRQIVPGLLPHSPRRSLDFACGTGRITEVIRPMVDEAHGIDVAESMVAHARSRVPDATFHLVDLTRNDSPVMNVDLVTAFRFFGNAHDELRNEALRAIHSVLRPRGHLIVNAHRNPGSIVNRLSRMRGHEVTVTLSHPVLRDLLTRNGFRIVRVIGIGGWLIRARLQTNSILQSRVARFTESMSRVLIPASVCPDAIFVAMRPD